MLIDYFGREITDAVAVGRRFPELAAAGRLSVRIDTPGGRYCEGLDPARSYEVLERHAPQSIRGYRTEEELRYLVGTGVSAAAIWHLRQALDEAGFPAIKIVGSSGFGPAKCRMMALATAPLDVIGTGSYLPELWSETYATADIIAYDGEPMVKAGREFLLRKRKAAGDGRRRQLRSGSAETPALRRGARCAEVPGWTSASNAARHQPLTVGKAGDDKPPPGWNRATRRLGGARWRRRNW